MKFWGKMIIAVWWVECEFPEIQLSKGSQSQFKVDLDSRRGILDRESTEDFLLVNEVMSLDEVTREKCTEKDEQRT